MPIEAPPDPEPRERDADQEFRLASVGGPAGDLEPIPVDDRWLDEVETALTPLGGSGAGRDGVARRAADQRILAIVATEGVDGRYYRRLAEALIGYGYPILLSWIRSDEIFRRCERHRRVTRVHDTHYSWTPEDRYHLAVETLLAGLELFTEHAVRRGKWDPEKGASLRTYYIGACLLSFGKVYHRWWRQLVFDLNLIRVDLTATDNPMVALPDQHAVDPCDQAVLKDQVAREVARLEPTLRAIVRRMADDGLTQREAAEREGLTAKAAERRFARHRQKRNTGDEPPEHNADTGRRGSA